MKERFESLEMQLLSPYAAKSALSKGRRFPITPCDLRTDFQRDRDRIIHCKSFRRLKHKTQVFLSPGGDHYRTRLTHTLEVSQVARTISRCLMLNEDLTEAIALGHDLGHTPFGHAGERALRRCLEEYGGFSHAEQSLRVVDVLENLNLTYEVRDGILCHTDKTACTLEGRVVRIADRIAYINHDIDDAVRAGLLTEEMLPASSRELLGTSHGKRIDTLIRDVVTASEGKDNILRSDLIGSAMDELHAFLQKNIYSLTSAAKKEELKAEYVVEQLFKHYCSISEGDRPWRNAADIIAGMTDRFAISEYMKLFVPAEWDG